MKPSSAKQKGRALQQFVAKQLLNIARLVDPETDINEDDIRSTPMGVNGPDVQLSTAARKLVNYDVECKNVERPSFWACVEQTKLASKKGTPLLNHISVL